MKLLPQFEHTFDMVFAVPPYFLSNNGLTIKNGQIVSVNKGEWDKSQGFQFINDFNRRWLSLVRDKMKDVWKTSNSKATFRFNKIDFSINKAKCMDT